MELLPLDVTDLATKQDLRVLSAELRAEMHEQTNRMLMFVLPAILSGIGLAFVAARF
jgi:hypothetical protein